MRNFIYKFTVSLTFKNSGIEHRKKTGPSTNIQGMPNNVATMPPAKEPIIWDAVLTMFNIPVNFPRLSSGNKSWDHAFKGVTNDNTPTKTNGKPITNRM